MSATAAVAVCGEAAERSAEGQWERHKIVIHAVVAAVLGEGAVVRGIREITRPVSTPWVLQARKELHRRHEMTAPLGSFVPYQAWETR